MPTSYLTRDRDLNTAIRDAPNNRFSTSNNDIAPLLQRYLNQRADYDDNMRGVFERIVEGELAETTSASGGPTVT